MKKITLLSLAATLALASEPTVLPKVTVEGTADTSSLSNLSPAIQHAGDAASLLADVPGVSLYTNGSTASLPVIRLKHYSLLYPSTLHLNTSRMYLHGDDELRW